MVVSIVTGAASGIGAATAGVLARRGDHVVCVDLDEAGAVRTADQLDRAIGVGADVTMAEDCERMVAAALEQFGGIDAAVACAGIEIGGPALDVDPAMFRRVVDVNLTGSFLTAQAAARAMRSRGHGGAIVLIGSINSHMALPGAAAYCASKGGVHMLGKALAVDLAPYSIPRQRCGTGRHGHAHER